MKKKVTKARIGQLEKAGAKVARKPKPEPAEKKAAPAPKEQPPRQDNAEIHALVQVAAIQTEQTQIALQQGNAVIAQNTKAIDRLSDEMVKGRGGRTMTVKRDKRDLIDTIHISAVK